MAHRYSMDLLHVYILELMEWCNTSIFDSINSRGQFCSIPELSVDGTPTRFSLGTSLSLSLLLFPLNITNLIMPGYIEHNKAMGGQN